MSLPAFFVQNGDILKTQHSRLVLWLGKNSTLFVVVKDKTVSSEVILISNSLLCKLDAFQAENS